jgi:cobalt-zinc-cadmium resistance protein CzcA
MEYSASTIMNLVRALVGQPSMLAKSMKDNCDFRLIIRLPEKARADPDAIRQISSCDPVG